MPRSRSLFVIVVIVVDGGVVVCPVHFFLPLPQPFIPFDLIYFELYMPECPSVEIEVCDFVVSTGRAHRCEHLCAFTSLSTFGWLVGWLPGQLFLFCFHYSALFILLLLAIVLVVMVTAMLDGVQAAAVAAAATSLLRSFLRTKQKLQQQTIHA